MVFLSLLRAQAVRILRRFTGRSGQAVALVFECGEDRKTKAVCLDKGLDFDVGDVIAADLGPLAGNRLFRGGEVREHWRLAGRRMAGFLNAPLISASPGHGCCSDAARAGGDISSDDDVLTENVKPREGRPRSHNTCGL